MLIVRSPVRISFAGGGTDLPGYYERFGGAVLSAAINKYFYTILTRRDDDCVQVISADLRCMETWENIAHMDEGMPSELPLPLAVLKSAGFTLPVNLFLASEIPPGTGLGSSGSVAVGMLHALATYAGRTQSRYELAERAFLVSRELLNKPVGKQDEYAAAFGGLNYIAFEPDGNAAVQPLDLDPVTARDLETRLLLFFTGMAHDSWRILRAQDTATANKSGTALAALHEIRSLADHCAKVLRAGDFDEFGACLHQGWLAKRSVSREISNERIDQFYDLARRHGALGGKITGAGGGGFLLLYTPPDRRDAVRQALRDAGLREMPFRFDYRGAHVLANDPFLDSDPAAGRRWTFTPAQAVAWP